MNPVTTADTFFQSVQSSENFGSLRLSLINAQLPSGSHQVHENLSLIITRTDQLPTALQEQGQCLHIELKPSDEAETAHSLRLILWQDSPWLSCLAQMRVGDGFTFLHPDGIAIPPDGNQYSRLTFNYEKGPDTFNGQAIDLETSWALFKNMMHQASLDF